MQLGITKFIIGSGAQSYDVKYDTESSQDVFIWLLQLRYNYDIICIQCCQGVIAMLIKPSTALRNEYNTISEMCKQRQEPIFLTKNGEGDLVLMSINTYKYREEMLDLREKLLFAEANRLSGAKTYTVAEVSERLRGLIDGNL